MVVCSVEMSAGSMAERKAGWKARQMGAWKVSPKVVSWVELMAARKVV